MNPTWYVLNQLEPMAGEIVTALVAGVLRWTALTAAVIVGVLMVADWLRVRSEHDRAGSMITSRPSAMRIVSLLPALVAAGLLSGPLAAQEKAVVAMIGTGNLAGTLGPALGRAGYRVIYGSREPERESVRELVARTGSRASATIPADAAASAEIIVLAVPGEVVEEVAANLGTVLDGTVVVDVSAGEKRIAADGYLEPVGDSAKSERLQSRHPQARVVRVALPNIVFFEDPLLVGTPPVVLIAADDPRAREVVAHMIFDVGLDPADAGPLRFSRVFDAMGVMGLIPLQHDRLEGYELARIPAPPLACFVDPREVFDFGRPYDRDDPARFPQRHPQIPCEEWRRRLGMGER